MIKQNIKTFNDTKLPKKQAFTIETEPDFPKLHTLSILSGRRGSGKSVQLANFLRKCRDKHYYDKVILITPTYNSNKEIWDICYITPDDVIEPDINSIKTAIKIVEDEKEEWDNFLQQKKLYQEFIKDKKGNLENLNSRKLLEYYSSGFLDHNKPEWKYPVEHPPRIAIILDDLLGTDVYARNRVSGFTNLAIKHRHIADGLGCSLFMLVQSWKCQSGVPRVVRENVQHLLLFRVNDENQIKSLREECDLPITDEDFFDMCKECHKIPHNFLFIDFAPKCPTKRFRSGWGQYIIPPSLKDKCTCNK